MKFRNLISVGLLATGLAMTAQAQGLYRGGDNNMRERAELTRRVEADRRAAEHERQELRRLRDFRESRELRAAQERRDRDNRALYGNRFERHDRY
jgi:hypothetical protein